MKVYETIISILEKKGPLPIPIICKEVNKLLMTEYEKPLKPSHIKSIVSRKKELFLNNEGEICLHPNKTLISLSVALDDYSGISYKIHVHFLKNRFTFLEWRNNDNIPPFSNEGKKIQGNMEDFKREIYLTKIWNWEPSYQEMEGIILEGNYWNVTLVTKGEVYVREGNNQFPENWECFCKAVEKLTGTFICWKDSS